MADLQDFGTTIRNARLDKGMSLGQLASAVGRSSSSIRRWERGEVQPGVGSMTKLIAILELDPDVLKAKTEPEDSETAPGDESVPDDSDGRVSTFEQPVVASSPAPAPEATQTTEQAQVKSGGLFSDAWAALGLADRSWIGWVRGLLTAAVLVLMVFVLIWALGELFTALNEVRSSFNVGTTDTG